MKRVFLFILLVLTTCCSNFTNAMLLGQVASPDTLPVPGHVKDMLFYLQRNPDSNTIIYQLNRTPEGVLNTKSPIHVFWIRYEEGGVREELNYIQRKFAFGVKTRKLGKDNYEVRLASYSEMPLYLRKNETGNYHVYATINKEEATLNRVFVRIEGGTFWSPNILYVALTGRDVATGKIVTERFKP